MTELERVEAQALRDAVVLGGGRGELVGGAMCFTHPRVAMPELNRAMPLGMQIDVSSVKAWFDGKPHLFCVPPGYSELPGTLRTLGYTKAGSWMKFRRDDAPAPPARTALRVEPTDDADVFARAASAPAELSGFVGAPGWAHLVAWDGDEPVASGALYAEGELAWVGVGATREEWRGRGAQSALLAARIGLGLERGARTFATETGETPGPSYRNILRAGFQEAYLRENWRSPA